MIFLVEFISLTSQSTSLNRILNREGTKDTCLITNIPYILKHKSQDQQNFDTWNMFNNFIKNYKCKKKI